MNVYRSHYEAPASDGPHELLDVICLASSSPCRLQSPRGTVNGRWFVRSSKLTDSVECYPRTPEMGTRLYGLAGPWDWCNKFHFEMSLSVQQSDVILLKNGSMQPACQPGFLLPVCSTVFTVLWTQACASCVKALWVRHALLMCTLICQLCLNATSTREHTQPVLIPLFAASFTQPTAPPLFCVFVWKSRPQCKSRMSRMPWPISRTTERAVHVRCASEKAWQRTD